MVKVAFLCFVLFAEDKMPLNKFAGHFSDAVDSVVFYVRMFYGEGCIFVFNSVAGDKMSLNTFAGHFSGALDSDCLLCNNVRWGRLHFCVLFCCGGWNAAEVEHICRSLLGPCRFRIVFYAIMFYGAGDHEQPAGYEPGDGAGHRPRHSLATCQLWCLQHLQG
jgi:hypothetical protein